MKRTLFVFVLLSFICVSSEAGQSQSVMPKSCKKKGGCTSSSSCSTTSSTSSSPSSASLVTPPPYSETPMPSSEDTQEPRTEPQPRQLQPKKVYLSRPCSSGEVIFVGSVKRVFEKSAQIEWELIRGRKPNSKTGMPESVVPISELSAELEDGIGVFKKGAFVQEDSFTGIIVRVFDNGIAELDVNNKFAYRYVAVAKLKIAVETYNDLSPGKLVCNGDKIGKVLKVYRPSGNEISDDQVSIKVKLQKKSGKFSGTKIWKYSDIQMCVSSANQADLESDAKVSSSSESETSLSESSECSESSS